MRIVTQIYFIENNRILDHAVISHVNLLKQHRILNLAIDDTPAGNQTVLHLASRIVLGRRIIVNLGVHPVSYTHLDVYKRQVNFWTPWCPYCKDEMPYFQAAHDTYKDQLNVCLLYTSHLPENAEYPAENRTGRNIS